MATAFHRLRSGAHGLLLLVLLGCKPASPPPAARPASAAPRIASAVPAATAMLVEIGAADRLVAVSRFDRPFLPPALSSLPVIGDYLQLNLESLLALHPSVLVTQFAETRMAPGLETWAREHQIQLMNLHLETLADIENNARELGKLSGCQPAAETRIRRMKADLELLSKAVAGRPRVRLVYLAGHRPLMAVGKGTFLHEILEIAGGENLAASLGSGYVTINQETLLKLAPDLIFLGASGEPPQQTNDPRLDQFRTLSIPASQQDRLVLLTDENTLIGSLEVSTTAWQLGRKIHPDMRQVEGAGR